MTNADLLAERARIAKALDWPDDGGWTLAEWAEMHGREWRQMRERLHREIVAKLEPSAATPARPSR